MWYKHFSKQSWNLRVWRFVIDDIGMFKTKSVLRWKDFLFRMCRGEGVIRGFNFFFAFGAIGSILYAKKRYYDPVYVAPKLIEKQKELDKLDVDAKSILFYNRYGAPSRPHRSLEDIIAFLAGSKTYDDLADFLSYDTSMDVSMDQQKGLDSWMSYQDRQALKYYQQSLGKQVEFEKHNGPQHDSHGTHDSHGQHH